MKNRGKGKLWIAVSALAFTLLGGMECLPVQAAEPEYVVMVEERAEGREDIGWQPFYITLAAMTVLGGSVVHIATTRRRKQDHKTGKRGL